MEIRVVDIAEEGGRQVIHLPLDFRIKDTKVYLRKTGNTVCMVPYGNPWGNFYASIEEFTEDFLVVREDLEDQERPPLD